jgi:O-antigen/teichoic acid export membrane protein
VDLDQDGAGRPQSGLGELQMLGMVAQAITMVLSVAQSMVVVRLLTVGEFGVVGIALGAGGVLDVLQHFTFQSAAVREMAHRHDRVHAQHVVSVAVLMRLVMVLPNSMIIFFGSYQLANTVYGQPGLQFPLQLLALSTIVSGVRAILENTLTALQDFKTYYVYLIAAFVLRLALFWVLVAKWRVGGYFAAELTWSLILLLAMTVLVRRRLGRWEGLPSFAEMRSIGKAMLGLSAVLFVGRLSYTWWKRGATGLLGLLVSESQVGLFHFGTSFAAQVLAASGALAGIYLPLMSRLAHTDMSAYRRTVTANLSQVLSLFWFGVGFLMLFAREVVLVVAGQQYVSTVTLLPPLVLAFFVQALYDLLSSSVLVPTHNDRWMLVAMLAGRIASLLLFLVPLLGWRALDLGAWGWAAGLLVGLGVMGYAAHKCVSVQLWRGEYLVLIALLLPWIAATLLKAPLLMRLALGLCIAPAYLWYATRHKMVDLRRLFMRLRELVWLRKRAGTRPAPTDDTDVTR